MIIRRLDKKGKEVWTKEYPDHMAEAMLRASKNYPTGETMLEAVVEEKPKRGRKSKEDEETDSKE